MRLLIIKRDKLGDLLLTRPVLDRARALVPHAEIHLLANDYNAWVASDHPALARTWIYPRVRSGGRVHPLALLRQIPLGWQLRRQRFEEGGRGVDTARHDHCATTVSRLPGGNGRGEPTVGNADPETAHCRK